MEGQNFIKISIANSLGFDMDILFENNNVKDGRCTILMKSKECTYVLIWT